jgi:nucleotide-binding universal stress UspA family protein
MHTLAIRRAQTVTTIVVGVEDSFRAEDAIALARDLALATDAEILAVNAYAFDDRTPYVPATRDGLCEEAECTLERLCEPISQLTVTQAAVADPLPARALRRAAEASGAWLIVVGSSRAEFTGRVHPGSTGRELLRNAPCGVVFAPQGYRMWPAHWLEVDVLTAAEQIDGHAKPVAALAPDVTGTCGKLPMDSAA